MQPRRLIPLLVFVSLAASSCRGVQIQKLEDRQALLEARVAKLEGQVELLSRK